MSQEQNKKRPMMGHGTGQGNDARGKGKEFYGNDPKAVCLPWKLSDCARRRNLICNRKYGI